MIFTRRVLCCAQNSHILTACAGIRAGTYTGETHKKPLLPVRHEKRNRSGNSYLLPRKLNRPIGAEAEVIPFFKAAAAYGKSDTAQFVVVNNRLVFFCKAETLMKQNRFVENFFVLMEYPHAYFFAVRKSLRFEKVKRNVRPQIAEIRIVDFEDSFNDAVFRGRFVDFVFFYFFDRIGGTDVFKIDDTRSQARRAVTEQISAVKNRFLYCANG